MAFLFDGLFAFAQWLRAPGFLNLATSHQAAMFLFNVWGVRRYIGV